MQMLTLYYITAYSQYILCSIIALKYPYPILYIAYNNNKLPQIETS